MIKGMTGFGNATISQGKVKGIVEIKSQNHRYFDLVYYLPSGFASMEGRIRQLINKSLDRGRISVSVKITEKPAQELTFNKEAVGQYLKYAHSLKKEYGLDNNLTLSDLIRLPGVVEAREIILDPESLWPAVEKALVKAIQGLMGMREREGKSLTTNFNQVLNRMLGQIKLIQARGKALLKEKKKTLTDDEFISYQKSNDIGEELTRLAHYVEEFKLHLKSPVDVGKKLDFVAQEMQRETNTIGSKVQDKIVSNSVIALKSKIEKLREQAQNIE